MSLLLAILLSIITANISAQLVIAVDNAKSGILRVIGSQNAVVLMLRKLLEGS